MARVYIYKNKKYTSLFIEGLHQDGRSLIMDFDNVDSRYPISSCLTNKPKEEIVSYQNYQMVSYFDSPIDHYYPSDTKGEIKISEMNEVHIKNAINAARRDRQTHNEWFTQLCIEAGRRGLSIG